MVTPHEREGVAGVGMNSWDEVYGNWKDLDQDCYPSIESLAKFDVVEIFRASSNQSRVQLGPTNDWWPQDARDTRIEKLTTMGPYGATFWNTKAGTFTTADLLWKAQGDPEKLSAIWIAASLWDKINSRCESWFGGPMRLARELFILASRQFKELGSWHHSSRSALPQCILDDYAIGQILVPQSADQLLRVVALEAGLVKSRWMLVRVLEPEATSRTA
jgi:hypothetical protein